MHELAAPLLKQVWAADQHQAQIEFQRQLRNLLIVQAGLLEDLQHLRLSERDAQEKAAAAEVQLKAQTESGLQLADLLRMMEAIGQTGGASGYGKDASRKGEGPSCEVSFA